jgi:hypothetical protein
LSGITWSGFNEFYYLFTYEDSRDLFDVPCKFKFKPLPFPRCMCTSNLSGF